MKELLREAIWASAIVIIVMVMSGCSTIEGAGKDMQDAARITRQYMADQQ